MRVMVCDAGDSGRATPELEAALEVAAEAVAFSAAALATAAKAEASPELVADRGRGAPHDHDFRLLLAGLPSPLAALSPSQYYGRGCSALGCVSAGDVSAPIVPTAGEVDVAQQLAAWRAARQRAPPEVAEDLLAVSTTHPPSVYTSASGLHSSDGLCDPKRFRTRAALLATSVTIVIFQ